MELANLKQQQHQSHEQNQLLLFREQIIKEAFKNNLLNEPLALDYSTDILHKVSGTSIILYLKEDACSPCNIDVIKQTLKSVSNNTHFKIASHFSNRNFLEQPIIEAEMKEEQIIWLNDKLFEEVRAEYDAEMLFINPKGFIIGRLPLALLKEEGMFELLTKNY